MWPLLRTGLYALAPETAHALILQSLRLAPSLYNADKIGSAYEAMGLHFPNRIGLAAGYDKNGNYLNALAKLGFGFIEVGTITPLPQLGSPRPRMFRLHKVGGLINRMGFNNLGVHYAARQLAARRTAFTGVLGCNIGSNRDTEASKVKFDYLFCLRELYGLADYFTINISSPNTPGLRDLQTPDRLQDLLTSLVKQREKLASKYKERTPLLVKVSPDLEPVEIKAMAQIIGVTGINGVITTNTTVERPLAIRALPYGGQPGGLSGTPLRKKAIAALALWRDALPSEMTIIGVGGIASGQDAKERFAARADLLQIYTGLIYRGPQLIAECAAASR